MKKNAIILAAGKSNRFAPFTYERPKGLFRVKNEILIERQIRQLNDAGVNDIYVVVGYMKEIFGVSCVELEQIADYTTEFAVKLDDNKIYVLCPGTDKIVKVFVEGSTLANNETDFYNANLQQVATLYKSYGVGAFTSAIAGQITLA